MEDGGSRDYEISLTVMIEISDGGSAAVAPHRQDKRCAKRSVAMGHEHRSRPHGRHCEVRPAVCIEVSDRHRTRAIVRASNGEVQSGSEASVPIPWQYREHSARPREE